MENTDCEKILNLIPLYIDNGLAEIDARTVRQHIASCDNCKKEYEFLLSVLNTAKQGEEPELSADFHAKLMAKAQNLKIKKRATLLKRSTAGVAAAAAVALCFVNFGNINNAKNTEPRTATVNTRHAEEPAFMTETPRSCIVAKIALTDKNRNILTKILAPYEKDHIGYIVPDIDIFLEQLAEENIDVTTEISEKYTQNYIILE